MYIQLPRSGNKFNQGLLMGTCGLWLLIFGIAFTLGQSNTPTIISGIMFITAWIAGIIFGIERAITYAQETSKTPHASRKEIFWAALNLISTIVAFILFINFR